MTTILDTLRAAEAERRSVDHRARVGEFLKVAQCIALHGGAGSAHAASRANPKVQEILKGLIAPIGTTGQGAALAEMRLLSEAFSTSIIGLSVFDTLLANGMRRVPLKTRGVITTIAPTGSGVAEGKPKPISASSFSTGSLEPQKTWAALAISDLLLDFSLPNAATLFGEELKKGVSRATDALFLSQLVSGTTPITAVGPNLPAYTFANLLTDLGKLWAAVDVEPGSRVFLVLPTSVAQHFAFMTTTSGDLALRGFDITQGGPLPGLTQALISDQLPANRLLFVVADGLIGNSEVFELKQIREGDIQLSSTPNDPASAADVLTNLWTNNLVGLAVERWLGFSVARARSVASLSW